MLRRQQGTDLAPTLAAHLDHGGQYDDTAATLSIHRNTLRYRLSRITEITPSGETSSRPNRSAHSDHTPRLSRETAVLYAEVADVIVHPDGESRRSECR
ncbi:helix-turn-helix domain-containing protein [Janibacter sp. YB324]|uniref:helix-turn-helix domain-containing protein n=1 Tax=Janibacter sp. YB324 TaxID=2761047 RepID=UPI001CB99864